MPIPDSAPRRGNYLTQWLGMRAMQLTGWQLVGEFPNTSKFVAVVAPHRTALKDFSIGMMAMYAMGVRFSFMIKHTVVRWPIGGPIRWLGGIPINRTAAHGVVPQVAATFKKHDKLILALTPEGTRSRAGVPVSKWKRGFYHIASRSEIPVMPVYMSYTHKRAVFGDLLHPSDDINADLAKLQKFYDHHNELE